MSTSSKAEKAFWDILSTGAAPTVASVRDRIGGKGSHQIIQVAVKKCWRQLGQDIAYFRSNPSIPHEILSLAHSIWRKALEEASQINAIALTSKLKKSQEELRSAEQKNATLNTLLGGQNG